MSKQKTEEKQPEDAKEVELKSCFVMMPISDQDGYSPGHFDRVYRFIIQPACARAGFRAFRADDIVSTNVIIVDILSRILESDMAICDLSAVNGNVMYELGIRQAFDKPVTLMKDDITKRIFDISSIRSVEYNSQLRFDQVNEAVENLAKAIDETYKNKGKELNSLVSVLGISKAEVKSSDLSNDAKAILQAINRLEQLQPAQTNQSSIQYPKIGLTRSKVVNFFLGNGYYLNPGDLIQVEGLGQCRVREITGVSVRTNVGDQKTLDIKIEASDVYGGFHILDWETDQSKIQKVIPPQL